MPRVTELITKTFPNANAYTIFKTGFYIVLTLLLARVLFWFLDKGLKRIFVEKHRSKYFLEERRAKTLYPLLRSILFYTISFFVIVQTLSLLGVSTTTLLASASIVGLALGFGAQSLVKDIISGFFIIFEDQFAVGEYIKTDQHEGIVEEIGIRTTKLRDWGGELHIIPNGAITTVTNYNRGKMRSLVDINLPYNEDVERAMEFIAEVGHEMAEEYKQRIVEGPTVQGIINLGEAFVVVRVIAYTLPMEQWEVERELRKRIMRVLSREGIHIPSLKRFYLEQ